MRIPKILGWVALVVPVSVGLVFFARMQSIPMEEHSWVAEDLSRIKQLDATLTDEVLESRYALLTNYDPIVQTLLELKARQADAKIRLHRLYPGRIAIL